MGSQGSLVQLSDENGNGIPLKLADNKIRVSSMPYTYDIAEGNVTGHSFEYKFGSNPAVGTGEESVWSEDGLYNWAGVDAAPGVVKISSSDVDDGGTLQVETIQCTAGESTGAGNITMTITAAGMSNSPKAVVVAVELSDGVNDVGLALRTALALDVDVASFFTVSGATDSAILTSLLPLANDATMAFGFADTDSTGVTFGASGDTTAGVASAGVTDVQIFGLNSTTGLEQNEIVTIFGQDEVLSTLEYSRVFRIICTEASGATANVGIIYVGTGTVTTGKPAVVWALAPIGANQSLMAIWTIPMGKTFFMTSFSASTNSNKGNTVNMYFRPPGELFQIKNTTFLFSTAFEHTFEFPLILAEMTDVDCRAIGVAGGAGISYTFEGWLE